MRAFRSMKPALELYLKIVIVFATYHACSAVTSETSRIRLVNNGYEGIVIGIHESIREDDKLIQNIVRTFTQASKELFIATRQRAFFRNITILVPNSWTNGTYQRATWQTYSKASIRVEATANITTPFVTHYKACGMPGEFMYLPKVMFSEKEYKNFRGKESAVPAKEIVHEWAHLRWGLFDEYPKQGSDWKTSKFYMSSSGEIRPIKCSQAIEGNVVCRSGQISTLKDYEENCRFKISTQLPENKYGSYLYNTSPKVTSFCDNNESDTATLHDHEAPNQQNTLCSGKSAWEVMRTHVDFANSSNLPLDHDIGSNGSTTIPHFTVVQRMAGKIVIVMDISGSMSTDRNDEKLSDAVKTLILNTIPGNSLVGLVRFDDRAETLTPTLKRVDTEGSRQALANLVQPLARGMTSIGAGLRAAYDLLSGHGPTAGSSIYLVTDGAENAFPMIRDVIPAIENAEIILDTLLYTGNADRQLINSSSMTGGRSFLFSGKGDSGGLIDILTSMVEDQQENAESSPIKLSRKVISASGKAISCQTVIVDEELGKDVVFSFTWMTASHSFQISVTSPSGQWNYTKHPEPGATSYLQAIPGLSESGKWNACISNFEQTAIQVTLQAQSKARNTTELHPVLVSLALSRKQVDFSTGSSEPLILYATVTKSYSPLINATVTAIIEHESGKTTELELRDNGAGADTIKDDGTYSRYLPPLDSKGMYSTKVQVQGNEGTAVVSGIFGSMSNSFYDDNEDFNDNLPVVTKIPVSPFERTASGELIEVLAVKPRTSMDAGVRLADIDSTPPSRIRDLTLLETSLSNQTITIQFTAVGDDYDEGSATRYHIRYALTYKELQGNFRDCTKINDTDVVNGTLTSPMASGGIETFTLRLAAGTLMVMAVAAEDEAGNAGMPSNIIVAQMPEEPTAPPTTDAPLPSSPSSPTTRHLLAIFLGSSIAVILVIFVVIISGFMIMRKRFGKASFRTCEDGTENAAYHVSTEKVLTKIPLAN